MFTAKEQLLEKRNGPDEWRTSERFASQHQHPNLKNTNKTHSPNSCFHVPWAGLLLVGCLLIPVVSPVSTLRRASAWPPGTWCIGGLCRAFPGLQDADGPESRHTSGSLRVTSPPPCRIRSCSPDTGLGAEEEFQHEMFCSLRENIGGNSLSAWAWAAQADTQKLL